MQAQNNNESVRYLHPIFDNVDIEKDIVFGEVVNFKGETEKLSLDVYTPVGDDGNKQACHIMDTWGRIQVRQ